MEQPEANECQLGCKNKQVRQAVNFTYLLKIYHALNK